MKKRNSSFERKYLTTVNKSKENQIADDRESDENDELLSKTDKLHQPFSPRSGVNSSQSHSVSNLNRIKELNCSHSSLYAIF